MFALINLNSSGKIFKKNGCYLEGKPFTLSNPNSSGKIFEKNSCALFFDRKNVRPEERV
jgi:hypothetical protein